MDKEKNIPSYSNFLEGLDYDPNLVQKYFESIIQSLEKELFSLRNEADQRLTNLYNDFDSKQERFISVKEDILRTYLNEYIRLNEEYENALLVLDNDYISKKSELTDKINLERDIINKTSVEYAKKFADLTKESNAKIRDIYKRIDAEYQVHSDIIFSAREALLKNNSEFYLNAETHLNELDKLYRFFNELNEYTSNLRNEIAPGSIHSNDQKIQIYLDYINENKDNWTDISSLLSSYNSVEKEFVKTQNELEKRLEINLNTASKIKEDKEEKIHKLNSAIDKINSHFDSLIEKETDKAAKYLLSKEKAAFILKVESDKERINIEASEEEKLINKDRESLDNFKSSIESLNRSVFGSYENRINKINEDIKLLLSQTEELLIDTKNSIDKFDSAYSQSKNLLSYFEKRYSQLSYSTRIKTIEEYKTYIEDNVKRNKRLDVLAFELLTNSEVRTLTLLDLQKEYLTVDENVKIKQVKYDIDREIKETTLNSELQIKNLNSEIELLKKDLSIDKEIKKHELNNAVKVLDLRKKIDIERVNYMEAYARLDNVKEMIDVKGMNENLIEEINTQIRIQKLIEISLLESVSRREQFDSIIEGYDESMKKLGEDTQSKIRYQNDVLEIERNTFEMNKKKLKEDYDNLRKSLYPAINEIKKERDKKINHIKNAFDDSKQKEIEENKKKDRDAKNALKEFKASYSNAIKSIDNSHKEGSEDNSPYFSMVNFDGYTATIELILSNVLKDANSILNKYYSKGSITMPKNNATSTFSSQIKKAKKKNERDKCYKEYKKESKQVLSKINSAFRQEVIAELPESKSEEEKMIDIYNDLRKKLIAEEAINASKKLSPYLDNLREVEDSRNNKNKELEDNLQQYKKQYLDTIKAIESDYEDRLSKLQELKENTVSHKENGNEDIDRLVYESIDKLTQDRKNKVILNDETNKINREDAQNKVNSLSIEATELSNTLDKDTALINEDNKNYREDMADKAKDDYKTYKQDKINNENELKNDLKYHDENRQNYFKEITVESLKIKESYKKKIEYVNEKYENKLADDTVEFEKLFDSTKVKALLSHDNISKPSIDLELEISKLTSDLVKQAKSLNDEMTKSSRDEYEKILNNLEGKDKILEGGNEWKI